jgi:hypothetical protein
LQFNSATSGFCTPTYFQFGCATTSNSICDGETDGILGMSWNFTGNPASPMETVGGRTLHSSTVKVPF